MALLLISALTVGLLSVAPGLLGGQKDAFAMTVPVRRENFEVVVLAPGRLESSRNTDIVCELERLPGVTAPTILTIVEDGSMVKAGQFLCEIDSSDYQELVRRQTIAADGARSTFQQAELDLEVAKIGLEAYLLGEVAQTDRMFRGQIANATSDLTLQKDRLAWTKRMVEKGYFSPGQATTEAFTLKKTQLGLDQNLSAFRISQDYSVPKTKRMLESQIKGMQATRDFQSTKLNREEERLALYKVMVERCTIRAPHHGLVILANKQGRGLEIFEGATVRQRQKLFSLPDLTRIEAEAWLHETTVSSVKPGMHVRVSLEALPELRLVGVVTSVAPLPYNEKKAENGSDVTYFLSRIQLQSVTPDLRPGMTTQLEIVVDTRNDVLAVPTESVTFDEAGSDICLVRDRNKEGVERRKVKLGASNHGLVEIVKGLAEGEHVVLTVPESTGARRATSGFGGPWDVKNMPPIVPPEKPARAARKGAVGGGGPGAGTKDGADRPARGKRGPRAGGAGGNQGPARPSPDEESP